MLRTRLLLRVFGAVLVVWPATAAGQSAADCSRNPDQTRWFVRAGASGNSDGTRDRPFASLADVERCAPAAATITVQAPADGAPPLDGGIRLKDRQKLFGAETTRGATPAARLTSTTSDTITLAHGNEVAHLHLESPAGAAIFGDNVNAAVLRDLYITRRSAATPARLDPALCRVVRAGDVVDNAKSTLRGCTSRQTAGVKTAVMLLADDGAGASAIRYTIQRVVIEDNPSHDKPAVLWPAAVSVTAGGRAAVTLDVQDSSIKFTVRGLALRGYDRATLTANVTNLRIDSLRSDGIAISTGFACSGIDKATKTPMMDCTTLAPAPLSDAHVVLHADGLRFTDTERRGQPNDAAAIEPVAFDQGRSTIEVHVARSDMTGAAALAMFTFYILGSPARDIIDLGCVNPAPGASAPDREACRKLGYTSPGQNRIFGNTRNSVSFSPFVEVALQGPGSMMAQGNYWGDIKPADGQGDALGDCTVHGFTGDPKDNPPPIKPVPESRCELYNIPSQGSPSGIDGRFHLASDPRPPK